MTMSRPNASTRKPVTADPTSWALTQHNLAEVFAELNSMNHTLTHRYTPRVGWYQYRAEYGWSRDELNHTLSEIRGLMARAAQYSTKSAGAKAHTIGFVRGVEQLARLDPVHITAADWWNSDPDWAGTPYGNVELTSGELFAPSPARLISLRLGAVPDDGKRPHAWLRFLNQATGFDVELIDFLQKWIGYCLTGHTSEHVLAFIYGPGGTGKSTFANVVRELLGQYARHSPMDTFLVARGERHPTDLAGFAGARLVTAVETDEGRPWDEAKLKALTGDDPITARYMRRDFFTYRPRFKLLVAGNELPTLKSPDEAMRRRFRVVPFINRPPKPDRNLAAKLRYELPDILTWALEGTRLWYDNGLGGAAIVEQATAAYFTDSDLIGQWLGETCTYTPGAQHPRESAATLWQTWTAWSKTNGIDPGTRHRFGRQLGSHGIHPAKIGGKIYRLGIQLRSRTTHPPTADQDQAHR